MAIPARLTLVTLGVSDLVRSRAFYAALGWAEADASQESVAFLQLGPLVLALWDRDALAADAHLGSPGSPGAVALAINLSSRDEVDAAFADALAAGATPLKAPEEVFWGGYSGYFGDPDGHPWELAHNPFWELSADGTVRLAT
jgi:uncharacterized glyoxalase superfamily protein PhnB